MRIKALLFPLLILLTLSLLAGCFGHRARHTKHDDARIMKHLVGELELTPAQQDLIAPVLTEVTALKQKGQTLRQQWVQHSIRQLETQNIDNATLEGFKQDQVAEFKALVDVYTTNLKSLQQALTDGQRTKLVTLIEKHQGRHEHF